MSTGPRAGPRAAAKVRTASAESLELAPQLPVFDFLDSKITVPAVRPGAVTRTALVNRLRAATQMSVVTVVAPAGYGKTILLAQWAAREARQVVWVTLDERDDDPVVLLRHIAAALDRSAPVEPGVVDALRWPGRSIWTAALPRLAADLSSRSPIVLVLDDVDHVRSRAALAAIPALLDDLAEESTVVLADRAPPRLPLAPLRATGRLLELGAADLAMTDREAQLLLRATGVRLREARVAELVEQCEGWPAALSLAARSIRDGQHAGRESFRFTGDDRYLADYVRSEYLSRLRPGQVRFLRRTSVLDRMSAPLCDAVLQDEGSGRELEKIERRNLFLVPLDNRGIWFRYHRLFRELLHRELVEHEPRLVPGLHRRAARWYQAHGDPESALDHAFAAGDTDRAAAILAAIAFPVYDAGRVSTLEDWLGRFEQARLVERYPLIALHGCRIHALRGRSEQAERWLAAATRTSSSGPMPDGSPSIDSWIALLRAWLSREGAKQMLADATAAVEELAEESSWRPSALVARGSALMLLGECQEADTVLASAADCARALGSSETQVVALTERALIAAGLGDLAAADRLSDEAHRLVATSGNDGCQARAIEQATTARMMLRHGRWNEARAALTAARELLPLVNVAVPWLAVLVRIEIARGLVTLRDAEAAREMLDEIDDLLRRIPGLGILPTRAEELRREVDAMPEQDAAHTAGLTPAELRLVPLLATHMSFREIAEHLYVSRNTIKTQAISVYRKLGVSSRSEAIAEARRLGLGEHLRVVIRDER